MPTAWPTICAPMGGPDIEMLDIINEYTEPDILPGNYPIFLMKVQGPDDACVFLKEGACSVYPWRGRVHAASTRLRWISACGAMTSTGISAWTAHSTSPGASSGQGLVLPQLLQGGARLCAAGVEECSGDRESDPKPGRQCA